MGVFMKFARATPVILFLSCGIFASGDYFPMVQGNTWLYSYVHSSGGWGNVQTDSGTVRWEMLRIKIEAVTEEKDAVKVAILRTFSQCRKKFVPGGRIGEGGNATAYDSVFFPPRVTTDTVEAVGINLESGIAFKGDTCLSFVHDPKASIPAGRLAVRDTVVSCLGKSASAVILDQDPCRSAFIDRQRYIAVKDIGPVEYHTQNSPYLMDAFWNEDWKLISTNVGTSVLLPRQPVAPAGSGAWRLRAAGTKKILEGFAAMPGRLTGALYEVNGRLVSHFETAIASPGMQRIDLPEKSLQGHAPGPRLLRLRTPDGAVMTGRVAGF
jgi:hypothetical protein